ncbi:hypothetical protein D6D24_03840 [Aureobasidium pullulans]|uniref:Uncharacterized protein n=1 Tax=Aureobasidium pullulans TaxID=5580 RepID=A0A4S8W3F2_AURPU|nr:hypothetical protein D6D24_03840 [Aureobasidium pullulans]
MLNLDLTRFERESIARLRKEEARYKGVSKIIAFLIPYRPLYLCSASGTHGSGSYYKPSTLRNPFPSPRSYSSSTSRRRRAKRSLLPFKDLVTPTRRSYAKPTSSSTRTSRSLTTLRRRVKELLATLPSVRRVPTSYNKEDPTLISGGASSPVNPTSNASSLYVCPSPTNDPDTRRRADRVTEEDRRTTLEYDLLRYRSPYISSTSRGRNAARTYTPKYISLADRTRRPYVVSPKERKRRRRDFEAAIKAKRLINTKELAKEERRAIERSRYLSRGDPLVFDLRSPTRSRSPLLNFPASYAISTIEVL